MPIVSLAYTLHELSNPIIWKKNIISSLVTGEKSKIVVHNENMTIALHKEFFHESKAFVFTNNNICLCK